MKIPTISMDRLLMRLMWIVSIGDVLIYKIECQRTYISFSTTIATDTESSDSTRTLPAYIPRGEKLANSRPSLNPEYIKHMPSYRSTGRPLFDYIRSRAANNITTTETITTSTITTTVTISTTLTADVVTSARTKNNTTSVETTSEKVASPSTKKGRILAAHGDQPTDHAYLKDMSYVPAMAAVSSIVGILVICLVCLICTHQIKSKQPARRKKKLMFHKKITVHTQHTSRRYLMQTT